MPKLELLGWLSAEPYGAHEARASECGHGENVKSLPN
jgi:hypothetical protein